MKIIYGILGVFYGVLAVLAQFGIYVPSATSVAVFALGGMSLGCVNYALSDK